VAAAMPSDKDIINYYYRTTGTVPVILLSYLQDWDFIRLFVALIVTGAIVFLI
jgi:hypothetical protein